MKLEVDVNEVVLANAGTVGEFRIRNSAKAFKILSDGLYSNKIRAIIRELSCNAIDSHVGAGKADVPFEIHLPSDFEPWFTVRDFGMGLDGNQVTSIYTTYFESTKTDSNDFIGALGLGSKSPFSYTENFTVTAIKDGTKRIYSAFINDAGVPSIAEMSVEATTECNGVEVKFSVTDRGDYRAFRDETRNVFSWFKNRPKVTGISSFEFVEVEFSDTHIVPGVHVLKEQGYNTHSIALMGNIAYPLNNIPNTDKNLGNLQGLLNCGLVLEFKIGELDFAASREQLSYVPLTLKSIKAKLEELNANLAKHIAVKADAITCKWERALYLYDQTHSNLFKEAVVKYAADTKFPLYDKSGYYGRKAFEFPVKDLAERGLSIIAFRSNHGNNHRLTPQTIAVKVNSQTEYILSHTIEVQKNFIVVLNDLKTGCSARARFHYTNGAASSGDKTIICLSHDSTDERIRAAAYTKFLKEIHNPPTVVKASTLEKSSRSKALSTSGIMYIRLKSQARIGYSDSYTWENYKDEIDENETYYYVALNNHQPVSADGSKEISLFSIKALMDQSGVDNISKIKILGVRKSRIKELQELDNWIWFEDKLKEETAKISDTQITGLVIAEMFDGYNNRLYTNTKVAKLVDPSSCYAKYVGIYDVPNLKKNHNANANQLASLCGLYGKSVQVDAIKKKIENDKKELLNKYPLLKLIRNDNDISVKEVAHYINLVDKQE